MASIGTNFAAQTPDGVLACLRGAGPYHSAPTFDEVPVKPEAAVQRQLEAYNARDLERFVAEYTDDVRIFRPPSAEPVSSGKAALAAHYASHRFNLPALRAEVLNRMVLGNKVVDHERVFGVKDQPFEAVAVYEVIDGRIRTVWFFSPD